MRPNFSILSIFLIKTSNFIGQFMVFLCIFSFILLLIQCKISLHEQIGKDFAELRVAVYV